MRGDNVTHKSSEIITANLNETMNVSKTSQGWVGPSSALAKDEEN